jgi:hypothetical protein
MLKIKPFNADWLCFTVHSMYNQRMKKKQKRPSYALSIFEFIKILSLGTIVGVVFLSSRQYAAFVWVLFLGLLLLFITVKAAPEKITPRKVGFAVVSIPGFALFFLAPMLIQSFRGMLYILVILLVIGVVVLARYWDKLVVWWYTRK